MPNWCNNSVTISHPDRSKMEALVSAIKEGKFFNHVIPVPKELTDTVSGHLGEEYAQELNQFKMELNMKYFGAKDWYDFCVNRWGTKWDVDAYAPEELVVDKYNSIRFGFDSAWSPPIGIYDEMIDQGYDVVATYYEPGMAFCGRWDNGSDDCYNIGNMSADEVADTIPSDLDEEYGITECMREYEEESQ